MSLQAKTDQSVFQKMGGKNRYSYNNVYGQHACENVREKKKETKHQIKSQNQKIGIFRKNFSFNTSMLITNIFSN